MTSEQEKECIEYIRNEFEQAYQNNKVMTPPWTWEIPDFDYEANEHEIDKLFELELKTWRYREVTDYSDAGIGYNGRAWELYYKIPTTIPEFYNWIKQQIKENSHHIDELLTEIGRELFDYSEETDVDSGEIVTAIVNYERSTNFKHNLFVFYDSLIEYLEDADFSHVDNPSNNEDDPIEFDVFDDELCTRISDFSPMKDGIKYQLINYGEDELSLIPFHESGIIYLWRGTPFATKEEAIQAAEENAEEA